MIFSWKAQVAGRSLALANLKAAYYLLSFTMGHNHRDML
jgi:hypothetical protein